MTKSEESILRAAFQSVALNGGSSNSSSSSDKGNGGGNSGASSRRTSPLEDYYNEKRAQQQATDKTRQIINNERRIAEKEPAFVNPAEKKTPESGYLGWEQNEARYRVNKAQEAYDTALEKYGGNDKHPSVMAAKRSLDDANMMLSVYGKAKRAYDSQPHRVQKTIIGAIQSSGAGAVEAGRVLYEGGVRGATAENERQLSEYRRQLEKAQENYNTALNKYGGDQNNVNVKAAKAIVDDIQRNIDVYGNVLQNTGLQDTVDRISGVSDRLAQSSAQNIAEAKKGLGGAGRFLVDAGVGVTQLGTDALVSAVTGIPASAVMAIRTFGAGSEEARQAGASYEQQAAYGAASAAVETLTEKIFDGVAGIYGKGRADEIVEKVVAKLNTDTGRTVARSIINAVGEGAEEIISDAVNPVIRAIYNGKSIGENYSDEDIVAWLYDGLVGTAIGGIGAAGNIMSGRDAMYNAKLRQMDTNTSEIQGRAKAETESESGVKVKQQAEAEAQANAARAALDYILSRGRVNQQQAAQIMNSPEFARMFEALTGHKLEGSTNQQRTEIQQAAREYAYNQSEQKRQATAERQAAEQVQRDAERALSEYSQQEAARDAEWAERRQQLENYGSYDSYVRGLIRDGMTPAEAGEIARNPQMREAWERLTGQKLPTVSTSRARQMIMETRGDIQLPQNQAPVTPQNSVQAQRDISTPPTTSNDVVARPVTLNSAPTADAMVQNTGTQKNTAPTGTESTAQVTPEATQRTNASDNSTPTPRQNVNSGQEGNSGRQRERGFSENIRTDAAMEENIRQSFDENPEMYRQLANKDTLAKAREIFNKGLPEARSTVEQALGAAKAGQKLAPEMVPLARMVANELSRSGDVEIARNILSDVAVELTYAGQFSQAGRILRDSDPNTALRAIEKALAAINTEYESQHPNSKWKAELTEAEREKVLSTDFTEDGAYERVYNEIAKRIGKEMPSTAFEKLTEIRRINMLLRPRTMIKNVSSNVPMVGLRKGAETLSAGIQTALNKMGALDASKLERGFASKEQKQLARDYYEANKGDINGGSNKWDMKTLLRQNRTIFKGGAIEKAVSKMTGKEIESFGETLRQTTYNLLEAGDAPFVKSAFVDSLSQYCAAKGITTSDGITREAIDFATANAMEATFKNANLIASCINKIKRESSPAVSAAIDVIMPFTTTPANIAHLIGQYSPIGFAKMFGKGGVASKIDAFSKATVGSAVMALGLALRSAGVITGGEDEDKDKAALDRATGQGTYSIGGKLSYDWAQPAGSLLAFGAEIADAVKGQEDWLSAVMNAIYVSGDSALNLSIFQNVISILKGSGKPTQQIIDSILEGGATQLVPGLAGDIAKIIDGTVRSTYTGGNVLDRSLAKVQAATPFASKSLPESVNVKGETNTRGGLAERIFNVMFNPANVTRGERNEVDEEIYRLYEATGGKTFFPSVSPYKIDYDNSTYKMDGKDRETFQKVQGQTYYELAGPLLDSEMYKALNDQQKANVLRSIRDYAFDEAKRQFIDGRGDNYSSDTWDKTSKLESPWEAIVVKAALNDAKDKTKANFEAVDQVLKNFGYLKDDTQEMLKNSQLNINPLLYAYGKKIDSESWYKTNAAVKETQKKYNSTADVVSALAVYNSLAGKKSDAEILDAIRTQCPPESGGKQSATVRRAEAYMKLAGDSSDLGKWLTLNARLRNVDENGKVSKTDVKNAWADIGLRPDETYGGITRTQFYNIVKSSGSYASNPEFATQIDDDYAKIDPEVEKEKVPLDDPVTVSGGSKSTDTKSWTFDDYMRMLGLAN